MAGAGRGGKSGGPWDWGAVYRFATVDCGRTDGEFWSMTGAQLVALASDAPTATEPAPEQGTLGDLLFLQSMKVG